MILSKVYEDAEHRLERNEITLGEFERLVDIEVIEPKRGEWLAPNDDESITVSCRCSNCGWKSHLYEDDVYGMPYCPNCGASMREREGE